jgi:hypothetical protein
MIGSAGIVLIYDICKTDISLSIIRDYYLLFDSDRQSGLDHRVNSLLDYSTTKFSKAVGARSSPSPNSAVAVNR